MVSCEEHYISYQKMDKGSDFITYVCAPSLKSAVITRIVVKLWELHHYQQTICCKYKCNLEDYDSDEVFERDYSRGCCINFTLMDHCSDHSHDHDFTVRYHDLPVMEKEVLKKLLALRLPKQLEREIKRYVLHIGQKFLSWIDPENFRFGLHPSNHICWTFEGTVHASGTIRSVYKQQRMDERIFMAISNACLEDIVKKAWKKLTRTDRNFRRTYELCSEHKYDAHLVVYWLCFCKNDFSTFFDVIVETDDYDIYESSRSVFLNMFNLAIETRNKLAARYFWQKLTEEEKNTNMMVWIDSLFESIGFDDYGRKDGFLDVLFFLLGQMNDSNQQRQVFQQRREDITQLLIFTWPWQKYLLQTISVMFSFMEEIDYVNFMGGLIFNVGKGRVIEKLFGDIWCASPLNFKMYFVEDMMRCSSIYKDVFPALFDIHDLTNITLVLNLTTEAEKRDLIFSGIHSTSFISSAINNLDDTDSFLKETLPSESDVSECKTLIIKYLKNSRVRHLLQDHDRKVTEDFLKWCLISEDEVHRFKNDIGLDTVGKIDI